MSASVIRRGLELFNEKDGEKRKQKKTISKKQVHKKRVSQKSKITVKNKYIKSAVDEYRRKQKKSQLKSNLEYFLAADNKTEMKHTEKIIKQNSGRRACHHPDLPVTRPEEKSVFTEQEFQKFQEEYFSSL